MVPTCSATLSLPQNNTCCCSPWFPDLVLLVGRRVVGPEWAGQGRWLIFVLRLLAISLATVKFLLRRGGGGDFYLSIYGLPWFHLFHQWPLAAALQPSWRRGGPQQGLWPRRHPHPDLRSLRHCPHQECALRDAQAMEGNLTATTTMSPNCYSILYIYLYMHFIFHVYFSTFMRSDMRVFVMYVRALSSIV